MKAAIVIGASRGIGRQIAITLSQNNYGVVVASKTVDQTSKLPGTIHSVVDEIKSQGGVAIPVPCDCRYQDDLHNVVNATLRRFGRIDVAVYNAGAILWKPVLDTPLSRFDLMMNVNVRGAYTFVHEALPHMLEHKTGRLVLVAPPIYSRFFNGKTPYSISKVGMTILAKGLANEIKGTGVSVSTLWPATVIKAHVTDVMNLPASQMRTPEIFADATLGIVNEPTEKLNGATLLDEDYLRSEGVTDFTKYRCNPDIEPPRMMPQNLPDLTVEEERGTVTPTSSGSKL